MNYFYKESTGLNADIKRHRDEEARLIAIIAKLEDENNENNLAFIKHTETYSLYYNNLKQNFLLN